MIKGALTTGLRLGRVPLRSLAGPVRTYVSHALHRLVSEDPEACVQLVAAGIEDFLSPARK